MEASNQRRCPPITLVNSSDCAVENPSDNYRALRGKQ